MKNLRLIILIAALGAGCGKKKNADAGKPGAANPPGAVTPKPSPPEQKSKPLPPAVVAAWEKARFYAGWVGPHKKYGFIRFSKSLKELETSKAVSAFKARRWKPGMLEQLTSLNLAATKITDAGLKEVAKLQKLTELNLRRCTQITDAGVAELKKVLPKCKIER